MKGGGGGIYRRPRSTFHSLHFMAEGESDRTLIRGANNTFYYRTLGELGRRNQIYFLSGIRLERRRALEADKGGRKFGGAPDRRSDNTSEEDFIRRWRRRAPLRFVLPEEGKKNKQLSFWRAIAIDTFLEPSRRSWGWGVKVG